jgi:transcriptional regulator with XRE-family HTH domain
MGWTCTLFPAVITGVNGEQIRDARERRGWTQQELADEVGVGVRTIGNWENGHRVSRNKMGKIRELLDGDNANPLQVASEIELLTELMRRADVRQRERSA